MANFVGYRALQKLRYFLADAFPFLARLGPAQGSVAASLNRFPRVASVLERVRSSTVAATLQRIASTFVIGHFTHDRLDWSKVPRDAGAVLRATIVVATLLCVLVPLATTWTWPSLSAEAISGTPGSGVAGWSVVLWLIAASLGWSTLLAGTGVASRAAFVPALALFLYFGAALVGALPKSWWSLLVPAQALLAVLYSESRLRASRWDRAHAIVSALLAGPMIAALAIVAIPTAPWFRGRLLLVAVLTGAPLGIGLWLAGRKLAQRAQPALRLDLVIALLTAVNVLLLVTLALRGGLTVPAGSIHAMAVQVTGFLWPLYFFIGAGVVFKVLRQTATVQRVAEVALPARFFVPLSLTLLVAATAVAWVKPVLLTPAFPWPDWLSRLAEWAYQASAWVWRSSLLRLTLDQLKWVLLGALVVALWALLRRRLTSAAMARVLFAVILIGFTIAEYYFQAFGFLRTPRNSALSLFIFTVFVLWLVHRTSVTRLMSESPWWPARSRIALYGAVLMFVLLPIHARAALHDRNVTNEIFLYLFFGSLTFGLPYYLYLYATRRFKLLPLPAAAALGWVLLGAVFSVALTVSDKIAIADWSPSAAWSAATAQAQALSDGRQMTISGQLPISWVVLRALLTVAALAAVGILVRQRVHDSRSARAASVFAVIGVAAGLACFSNRGLELPLVPQGVTYLIAPLNAAMIVDASLIARQLAILIPVVMLGTTFSGHDSGVRHFIWCVGAAAVAIALGLIWPAHEPWLRSTGALFAVGAVGLIALCALALRLRDSLDAAARPSSDGMTGNPVDVPALLLSWRELRATAVALVVLLSIVATTRLLTGRTQDVALAGTASTMRLPTSWTQTHSDPARGEVHFTRPSWSAATSTLVSAYRSQVADSSDLGLLRLATANAEIEPIRFERWEQFAPRAFAVDFRVKVDADSLPSFGTAAVARLPNGDALLLTAMYSSMDLARRWDVARAVQALPR
jgi:hypothetical protein